MRQVSRRSALRGAATMLGAVALPAYARAQSSPVELKVQYSIPVLFKELMENIAHSFMAKHDAIKISLRAPEIGYEEIHAAQLARCRHQYLPTSPSMVSIASERYWSATFRSICGR